MSLDYLLIGHFTADLTPQGRIAGGTVSYALRTAAAFGLRVGVLTSAVPDDPLLETLKPYAAELKVLPAAQTTTYENIYDERGRTQYVRGVAAPIRAADIPPQWLDTPLVHFAPIAGEIDRDVPFMFTRARTLLTLQGWLRAWDETGKVHFKPWQDVELLRAIEMVVFSEEDIAEAPRMERQIVTFGRHIFVTRAERGGTYYRHGVPIQYPTPQVTLVNPTGAGDVFAAALLASLHHFGDDLKACLKVAARLGATAVTRPLIDGAPTPDEVKAALAEARSAYALR